jgi:predicted SAM-dependent methyltransferase
MLLSHGISESLRAIGRRTFRIKAKCFKQCVQLIRDHYGVEIGGPSSIFMRGRLLPIYPVIHLDNCNFSTNTIWGDSKGGGKYFYDKKQTPGSQYICDATEMACILSGKYDFLLSSHVLEHIANPIKALREWIRVLKEKGTLILILPQKDRTFDHKRPVTSLSHLIQDYTNNLTESDLTHLSEVLELHDLKRDLAMRDRAHLEIMCKENLTNRCMHHHVFDTQLAVDLISYVGLQIVTVEVHRPYHIILVAKKLYPEVETGV